MFDVIIVGGAVVDGTGAPGYRADVGVTGDSIKAIGDLSHAGARRVIDATGLTVTPGFIDTHAHSDGALLMDPQHANGLRQGITTEILGQDGLSYAPLSSENYRVYRRYLSGILGDPPEDLDMSSVSAFRSHYDGKVAINTAYCVAHGAVRLESLGFRDAPLTGDALDKARRLVREGIEQGAVGFATGMSYFPNAWSDTEELVELCKVVAEFDGVYITHLRDVHPERGFGGGGITEALEIGRRADVKVHFSHHRTAVENAGQVEERVEEIDRAKAEGVDCTLELYPYPTGSGYPMMFLPSEANEGGPTAIMERLRDPVQRRAIAARIDEEHGDGLMGVGVFTHLPSEQNRHLEGKTFLEAARERVSTPGETICSIMLEEELTVGFLIAPPSDLGGWEQVSRDAVELLSRPDYMVGSDSISAHSRPHPRAYGTFPRLLGRLRRNHPVMSVEAMVQRMADNPARRFGLAGRGRIQEGYHADIVVFDEHRILDTATYDDPMSYPVGIPFVLVNGQIAVDHERCTGTLSGQGLRSEF
jgi:N-acyl-D-amino-acid deacylase